MGNFKNGGCSWERNPVYRNVNRKSTPYDNRILPPLSFRKI
ncbi:MAG: hypothetical protein JRF31_11975 [Deltaproteobacteria bacterium]|nr:hypothetical protein [Deltaproteobacteria bacterium]MBW2014326.1 hypothetical protein [Deltaproteobacteria bacterium]MBW2088971.1 hypothetical protein [Deltaproteobacteria bacterium]MBW2321526.1 hypothetical protein [Deltaproteobacteria bacterium]